MGSHTFKWIYSKDSSISLYSDCGWLDYVMLDAASITSYSFPSGNKYRGDSITTSITVKNTGTTSRSFWGAGSYKRLDGLWYDLTPQQTSTLSPGSSQVLTLTLQGFNQLTTRPGVISSKSKL